MVRSRFLLAAVAAIGCSNPSRVPVATASSEPAADSRFRLEVGGSVTTKAGQKSALVDMKSVQEGDSLYLTVKTSKPATVFVAYCDDKQHPAIYPPKGQPPLIARPDAPARIPREDTFTVDDHPGLEHLFVIATTRDLAQTDPKLAELIDRAQTDNKSVSCSSEIAMTTNESRALAELPPIDPQGGVAAGAPAQPDPAPFVAATPPPPKKVTQRPKTPRVASKWRPRGLKLGEASGADSTESDDAGIAIWAISFDHK